MPAAGAVARNCNVMVIIDSDGISAIRAVTRPIVQLCPLFDPIRIVFDRGESRAAAENKARNIYIREIVQCNGDQHTAARVGTIK